MVYMIALNLFRRYEYTSQWLKRDTYILETCGSSYMRYNQHAIPTKQCKVIIHRRIEDIALQKLNTDISTSSMCIMYILYTNNSILKTSIHLAVWFMVKS